MAAVLWPRVFKEERCRKLKLNHIGTFFLEINKLSHQFRLQQNKKVPIVDSFKLVPCDYQSTYCNLNSTNWAPSLDYNKIKKIPIVDSFKLVPCDYQSTYCNKLIATWRQFSGIRQAISKQSRAELTNEVHNIDSFSFIEWKEANTSKSSIVKGFTAGRKGIELTSAILLMLKKKARRRSSVKVGRLTSAD